MRIRLANRAKLICISISSILVFGLGGWRLNEAFEESLQEKLSAVGCQRPIAWRVAADGGLSFHGERAILGAVKLTLENLPASLQAYRGALIECLEAMNRVMPLREVYLFGSHARGDPRPDSDVDLCIVAEGAERQIEAAQRFRRAMSEIRPKPAFTLIPIAPQRLGEKKAVGDHFFKTLLREGVLLTTEN